MSVNVRWLFILVMLERTYLVYIAAKRASFSIATPGYWDLDTEYEFLIHFDFEACTYVDYTSNCSFMTFNPTGTPTQPTNNPSYEPSQTPTNNPSQSPSQQTGDPSSIPTYNPSHHPS
eukprot:604732_1